MPVLGGVASLIFLTTGSFPAFLQASFMQLRQYGIVYTPCLHKGFSLLPVWPHVLHRIIVVVFHFILSWHVYQVNNINNWYIKTDKSTLLPTMQIQVNILTHIFSLLSNFMWTPELGSNQPKWICSPLHNHSAIG